MAEAHANGNGNGNGAIPNKVLAWAIVAITALAAVVGPLYVGLSSEKEHMKEILSLRDRIHEARQEALDARISGQDTVLQREMRLLDDATNVKVDTLKEEVARLRAKEDGK